MPGTPRDVSQETRLREMTASFAARDAQSTSFLAAIVNSSEDAIITKTLDGVITSWNPGAERIYGYTAEEAIGRSISFIAPPERKGEIADFLRRIARGERVEHFETDRVHKDGRRLRISLTVSPICDDAARVIGASAIARDITERKRADDLLKRQARELAEASERKSAFLAELGHELRNPLGAIANAVALVDAADGDPGVVGEALGIIRRQTGHAARLVDDLLDVSRIGRGMLDLERETLDLREVVRRAVEIATPEIDKRSQHLEVDLPAAPVTVDADSVRLGQVVANLLSNAAKYSDDGGCIELAGAVVDGEAVVRVRDRGAGIDPCFLPHVFDLFARDAACAHKAPGLGLGLTLVRQLVELHGGEVLARSAGRDQGSEFEVRLPLAAEEPVPAAETPDAAAQAEGEEAPLRVLLVDDHEEAVTALQTLLALWGHEVRMALDGPEALEAAAELEPDLVLLDIGLPGMDGWEVARRLRRMPAAAGATLVALTGYGQDADRAQSREAGFDDHVVKPIRPDQLKDCLAGWRRRPAART